MSRLEPLQLRTLQETRVVREGGWGEVGVFVPHAEVACWAELRVQDRGGCSQLFGYAPSFRGCESDRRTGYLTCLAHHNRELAARELKCETDGVAMRDIAFEDEAERLAHGKGFRLSLRERLIARVRAARDSSALARRK